jgi:hypothetical protein
MTALRVVAFAAGFGLLGEALSRVFRWELDDAGVARLPLSFFAGITALYAVVVHPAVFLVVLLVAAVARGRVGGPLRRPVKREAWGLWLGAMVIAVAVVFARPRVPLLWDEFVWLAKARLESPLDRPGAAIGFGSLASGGLREAALDVYAGVVPPGYPLLWSLLPAWLAGGDASIETLVFASAVSVLAAFGLFAAVVIERLTRTRALLVLSLLAVAPLFFVHLRSSYADATVGLLAASLGLLLMPRDDADDVSPRVVCAIPAMVLTGLKDEGLAHVFAVCAVAAIVGVSTRSRARVRLAAATFACAVVPFAGYRVVLRAHGVIDADHQLGLALFRHAGSYADALVRHVTDTRTWGPFWGLSLGAVIGCAIVSDARARRAAQALSAQALLLSTGLVFGNERVRTFALSGTLINRLLVQLVPAASIVVAAVLTSRRNVSSGTAAVDGRTRPTPRAAR